MDRKLLKAIRLYKEYSQNEMAAVLGISRKMYGLKEGGKKDFTISDVVKIKNHLELSLDDVNKIFFAEIIAK